MSRTPHRFDALALTRRLRSARRRSDVRTGRGTDAAPIRADIRVEHVDDPELPFRLVRAAGIIDPSSIECLVDAWADVMAPASLHLDLGDARIDDAATMHCLESALDDLERHGIAIRLVGIDPHHPVLHG